MLNKPKNKEIVVGDATVRLQILGKETFFCLTDLAKSVNPDKPDALIANWMRAADTIELLSAWEVSFVNEVFNIQEANTIRSTAGSNRFSLSVKEWVGKTGAIGIYAKAGRYGGSYAHEEIALAFCNWLKPTFHLYFIKEYKRLKMEEMGKLGIEWDRDVKRFFSKVNYHIHSDAVKFYLIPLRITQNKQDWVVYASEADLLNRALFGTTAKEWKLKNPDLNGNMRDYASAEELLILANLENLNAEFIHLGLSKDERLLRLNEIAIHQMELMIQLQSVKSNLTLLK
jgi:hypothetical protein